LLNLVVNAAQAIPLGNRDANEIVLVARRDDEDSVRVEVRDTGVGIPPEHLDRVFEPFFTTRPLGTASGMGLAVAMGLVTDHGGTLAVESRVGAGSTFRVHLPAHPPVAAPPPARRSPPPTSPAPHRRARVVVIDDEPLVLDVIRRILEADHDVRVHTDPRAALAELLSGEPADVVLCDLMMPELTGMDVFEAIERARPALAPHVVFMSGCAFSDRALGLLRRTSNLRLDKPFDTVTLLEAVRSLTR
jgi:CheY-like chemotaxis protein